MVLSYCNLNTMTGYNPRSRAKNSRWGSEPSSRNSFEFLSTTINEALGVLGPESDLYPIPINPQRIQVLGELKVGSTWNPKDPNTELVRWLFTTRQTTKTMGAATEREEQVQEDESYEPLVAFSSAAGGLDEFSTIDHSDIVYINDALRKPEKWEERFHEFVKFQKEFGHCLVPHNWPVNKELAQWVKRQRYQFKLKCKGLHNTLTEERLRSLEKVGFIWNSHHAIWEEKLQELKEFKKHYGHCNVPSGYTPNRKLSVWVRSQRRQYKLLLVDQQQQQLLLLSKRGRIINHQRNKRSNRSSSSHMTKERFQKLQSIGFDFNPRHIQNKKNIL